MLSSIASRLRGETNPLYRLREELKSQGRDILDFVSGNVNEHGIAFPQQLVEDILLRGARTSRIYRPDSLGQLPAREAISDYYHLHGFSIPPENVLLTPGTSVAYWYLFKLLANEGEEILCPRPSYPLCDYIAALGGVRLIPYRLDENRGWAVDLDHLDACVSTRTRALVLISPHNPTGHVSSLEEIAGLADIALRHDLAILSDEVFSEFLLASPSLPRPAGSCAPLVFTLNGFSKMFALPGLKLGWIASSGDPDRVRQAMQALELVSDTFLPVNEPIQAAVSDVFKKGESFRLSYVAQILERWTVTQELLTGSRSFTYVQPGGGFYVTLRLAELEEELAAETILRQEQILVHPGYFYDMDHQHLVISFIQEPAAMRQALPRLLGTLERLASQVTPRCCDGSKA